MNIHQIDLQGSYDGTVEISEGIIEIKLPTVTSQNKIKLYNLHLLSRDRKNIEFNLIRFHDGAWCEDGHLQLYVSGEKGN